MVLVSLWRPSKKHQRVLRVTQLSRFFFLQWYSSLSLFHYLFSFHLIFFCFFPLFFRCAVEHGGFIEPAVLILFISFFLSSLFVLSFLFPFLFSLLFSFSSPSLRSHWKQTTASLTTQCLFVRSYSSFPQPFSSFSFPTLSSFYLFIFLSFYHLIIIFLLSFTNTSSQKETCTSKERRRRRGRRRDLGR